MLSDASQAASFGFNIQSISTETPVASRMQSPNLPAASAPGSVGGSSSSLGSAPGGEHFFFFLSRFLTFSHHTGVECKTAVNNSGIPIELKRIPRDADASM